MRQALVRSKWEPWNSSAESLNDQLATEVGPESQLKDRDFQTDPLPPGQGPGEVVEAPYLRVDSAGTGAARGFVA